MHGHDDAMGLIGLYPPSYDHHSTLNPNFSISPSASPTDLHGFPCTTNSPCFPNFHPCIFDMPQADDALDSRPADDPHAVYHLSEPKPLSIQRPHYHAFTQSQGGILDSPLVSSPVELPLSPPRTLPLGTRELPGDEEPMFFGTPQFDAFQRSGPFDSDLTGSHRERSGTQESQVDIDEPPVFFGTPQFDSQRRSCCGFQDKDLSDSESTQNGPLSPISYFSGLAQDGADPFMFSNNMQLSPPETPSPSSSTDSEQDLPLETPSIFSSDLPSFNDPFQCEFDFQHDSHLLSSPCGRSLSDLPDFDDAPQSPSPSNYLLNLPGLSDGAASEELFPLDLDLSVEGTDAMTVREEKPLLFSDSHYLRSPSLESLDWDFDPAVVDACTDPDLQNLLELRRKSEVTVRSARQMEEEMLAAGDYAGRMAVRRMRKKAKDRAKEITSMLRLKLYHTNPAEAPSPIMLGKEPVRSMDHLVARMMYRRKDICKPMSPRYESWEEGDSRHSSLGKYARGQSSLCQSAILQSD